MKCFLVKLKTTNSMKNTVDASSGYVKCNDGFAYFIGDWDSILNFFGEDNIISIEYIGNGYTGSET